MLQFLIDPDSDFHPYNAVGSTVASRLLHNDGYGRVAVYSLRVHSLNQGSLQPDHWQACAIN